MSENVGFKEVMECFTDVEDDIKSAESRLISLKVMASKSTLSKDFLCREIDKVLEDIRR